MTAPKPLPKPEEVTGDESLSAVEGDAVYEVPSDDVPAVGSPAADSAPSSASVAADGSFDGFAADSLQLAGMQTVLLSFLLLAVLLNLGANLWLAFSDKWRS